MLHRHALMPGRYALQECTLHRHAPLPGHDDTDPTTVQTHPTRKGMQWTTIHSKRQKRKYVALCTRDEVLLQAVAKETTRPGFKLVEAVLDSGAEESVSPPRFFPGPVVPSKMSMAGGS